MYGSPEPAMEWEEECRDLGGPGMDKIFAYSVEAAIVLWVADASSPAALTAL